MNKQLEKIIETFKKNQQAIANAINEDESNFDFSIEKTEKLIRSYEGFKVSVLNLKLLAITNGNPYSTMLLCLQSIFNKSKITICPNNKMNALNKLIVKLIAQNCSLLTKPEFKNRLPAQELADYVAKYPKMTIMVVDDIPEYISLVKLELPVRYCPIFSMDLFYDNSEFDESIATIDRYCDKHYINLNIYSNESQENILIRENKEVSSRAILVLSQNISKYDGIEQTLQNKIIYKNYNPFDQFEDDIIKQVASTKPY